MATTQPTFQGRVTALKPHAHRPRVRVYLDGRYAFSLAARLAEGLQVGQWLSAAQAQALLEADAQARAVYAAAQWLARRPRSVAEIRQRLARRGYPPAAIDAALEQLQALGWLDDAAFARQWVENRSAFRPRGRALLQAELRRKGVPQAAIDAALAQVDDEALALAAARKALPRYRGLPWPVFARRLSAYLARRGFPRALVHQVVRQMWHEAHPTAPEPEQGAET